MLSFNADVIDRQQLFGEDDPTYNIYENEPFCNLYRMYVETALEANKHRTRLSKHDEANLMLLIFYGYPEISDVCFPDIKLPKDSFNRLFLMLGRYNKAIKRKDDLNMKKILRGIVLKEVVEPLVEFDPANIPLSE
jgi:hypothetical protein